MHRVRDRLVQRRTALINELRRFLLERGITFAAWVGVVPRQYSTGGKQKLYGISKRRNVYLRRMLIHSARAVLFRTTPLGSGRVVQRPRLSPSAAAATGGRLMAVEKKTRRTAPWRAGKPDV